MPIPLTAEQEKSLTYLYKDHKFGIKKLYALTKERHPELEISYRQIADFLSKIPENQIARRLKKTKSHIKPIISSGRGKIFQIDLIDYARGGQTAPNQYKYILVILDVFSRYVWLTTLKNKDADTVSEAFLKWYNFYIKNLKIKNIRVMTDKGSEFKGSFSKLLDQLEIKQHTNDIAQVNGLVERANGSIKRILERYVKENGFTNKLQHVNYIAEIYNSSIHSSLGDMKPSDVFFTSDPDVIKKVNEIHKQHAEKMLKKRLERAGISMASSQLEIGDKVRVGKVKDDSTLDKDTINNYSEEIYTVLGVKKATSLGNQDRYRLARSNGVTVKNLFFRDQLLKIPKDTKKLDYTGSLEVPDRFESDQITKRTRKTPRRLIAEV